jgi:hypothetical protein
MTRPVSRRPVLHDDLDLDSNNGTASRSVRPSVLLDATRTAAAMLTVYKENARHRALMAVEDTSAEHEDSYLREWRMLSQQRTLEPAVELLDGLADLGFAWRHIAAMVGVTVPAVQKWRRGERITGENLGKLARLVGACDFISQHYSTDIASWFEAPIIESAPVTPIDLWASGNYPLFFEHLTKTRRAEEVLDRFEPNWRERYRSDFEVFEAEDGNLSIRPKAR